MAKNQGLIFLNVILFLLASCQSDKNILRFATSAEYPPFEYKIKGELVGFDIELAQLIAKEMGKEIEFQDMQFASILPAVQSGRVDAAIATITITEERKKSFDFSDPYYTESLSMVYSKKAPILKRKSLAGKKIACQLGTIMEIWLENQPENIEIIKFNSTIQSVESLKAGHVDGVLVDQMQAIAFTQKNILLDSVDFASPNEGYGIAFKQGSSLRESVNKALKNLESKEMIQKLKDKYLSS